MMPARLPFAAVLLLFSAGAARPQVLLEHAFDARAAGEAVATISAGCDRCDWGEAGRETVALKLSIDGRYSQHLLLTRGEDLADYRVLLGSVLPGRHQLTIERDARHSAREAGATSVGPVRIEIFDEEAAEFDWLSTAPILHARPGTLERFSDVPLLMYVETAPPGEEGFLYTVIFTHEDGGTPTDRLMATWGRSTDIEYVYGIRRTPGAVAIEEYQGKGHEILPFRGKRDGRHPLLWVSTDNNMFSDAGPDSAVRFAPAPILVSLDGVSRETVMDDHPWTYAVMAAELRREGRIDAAAAAGSGRVPDPRRFAYLEACGHVDRAALAFDVATGAREGAIAWHATDRGDERFRIRRSGCFRAAVPVPAGTTPADLVGVRGRGYTQPCDGSVPLDTCGGTVGIDRVTRLFMLDEAYRPVSSPLTPGTRSPGDHED